MLGNEIGRGDRIIVKEKDEVSFRHCQAGIASQALAALVLPDNTEIQRLKALVHVWPALGGQILINHNYFVRADLLLKQRLKRTTHIIVSAQSRNDDRHTSRR
jgi:hypothetical protein